MPLPPPPPSLPPRPSALPPASAHPPARPDAGEEHSPAQSRSPARSEPQEPRSGSGWNGVPWPDPEETKRSWDKWLVTEQPRGPAPSEPHDLRSGSGSNDVPQSDPDETKYSWDVWLVNEWGPSQPVPIANATWDDFERAARSQTVPQTTSREQQAREFRELRLRVGWDWLKTPLADVDLVGPGWLSTEEVLHGIDDRGLTVEEELAAATIKLEDVDVGGVKQEEADADDQWDPVGINLSLDEYLNFCEAVRVCASRRTIFGQPKAHCTRTQPCVRCRYHPGATLRFPAYWRSISEDEVDQWIALRHAQRLRRDVAIQRARERRTLGSPGWRHPSSSPPSHSPGIDEDMADGEAD